MKKGKGNRLRFHNERKGEDMRNTKVCPKCGSHDIVVVPGSIGVVSGVGNNIYMGWFRSAIRLPRYLCCGCGFSEEWVDDLNDLAKIKKKYGGG